MLRPVKSWMGEISAKSSFSPSRMNQSEESRWTLIRFGIGATSVIRANECRAAPSATARETGRASASAIGLLHTSVVRGDNGTRGRRFKRVAPRRAYAARIQAGYSSANFKYMPRVRHESTKRTGPHAVNPSVHVGGR